MTEREICVSYREARKKNMQVQILADLNCASRMEIVKILLKNGERPLPKDVERLYGRLDALEAQIIEKEREYREIADMLASFPGHKI